MKYYFINLPCYRMLSVSKTTPIRHFQTFVVKSQFNISAVSAASNVAKQRAVRSEEIAGQARNDGRGRNNAIERSDS